MEYRRDHNADPLRAIRRINEALACPYLLPASEHLKVRAYLIEWKRDLQRPPKPK